MTNPGSSFDDRWIGP